MFDDVEFLNSKGISKINEGNFVALSDVIKPHKVSKGTLPGG